MGADTGRGAPQRGQGHEEEQRPEREEIQVGDHRPRAEEHQRGVPGTDQALRGELDRQPEQADVEERRAHRVHHGHHPRIPLDFLEEHLHGRVVLGAEPDDEVDDALCGDGRDAQQPQRGRRSGAEARRPLRRLRQVQQAREDHAEGEPERAVRDS
ncbi:MULTISPECIES: hypothetical protein [unclassified Streptomyces]|uniref:hypothetical protein n=1 Tax=unclassified Streptomyces TaxID=2593676 RepID=UPI0029B56D03|nr:hypothetical protein [Streptomyces sp. DK15]MDX2389202.1 hypothetical protein [Streptomyces sp. DK15]